MATERTNSIPPPLPARPRPQQQQQTVLPRSPYTSPFGYGSVGSLSNPYGSVYGGGYGTSYGSYAGFGLPYGTAGYGSGHMPGSSFARRAEETSRSAFESVESVVQAFGSISMMLESTLFAVQNSFRAVIGVADQLSNVRRHLFTVLGALRIFKFVRYVVRRLAAMLGFRRPDERNELWNDISRSVAADAEAKNSAKSWPVVLFFAVVVGTPWLIWRFVNMVAGDEAEKVDWASGSGEHFVGEALYEFEGENPGELSFSAGATLRIAPKDKQPRMRGWLLASDGEREGIVPANYVKIMGRSKTRIRNRSLAKLADGKKDRGSVHPLSSPIDTDSGLESTFEQCSDDNALDNGDKDQTLRRSYGDTRKDSTKGAAQGKALPVVVPEVQDRLVDSGQGS